METINRQPDPEEEPESSSDKPSSSDMPTGQYSPMDKTPDPPLETPGGYPVPDEPLTGKFAPDVFTIGQDLPAPEPARPFRAYTPPAETTSGTTGASVYPPPPPQSAFVPPQKPVYTPSYTYTGQPTKDRSLALVAEALPGLFAMGIGWIYAGNTSTGIILLIGSLIWNLFASILDVITVGIFLCVHAPVNLIAVIASAILLYNYTKKHPELFGA